MKVEYTLTDDEELALTEVLSVENRHKEPGERKTANDLIVKILKAHLKIHVDKIKARKVKSLLANYETLSNVDKAKVDKILKGEV